jgi:hypothetical protein
MVLPLNPAGAQRRYQPTHRSTRRLATNTSWQGCSGEQTGYWPDVGPELQNSCVGEHRRCRGVCRGLPRLGQIGNCRWFTRVLLVSPLSLVFCTLNWGDHSELRQTQTVRQLESTPPGCEKNRDSDGAGRW